MSSHLYKTRCSGVVITVYSGILLAISLLWLSLDWLDRVGNRKEGWLSVALGIFLFQQDLAEQDLPRKEILEQVLLSVWCKHLACCWNPGQPQDLPGCVQYSLMGEAWKAFLYHQLFPMLGENNEQANKRKQKIGFFIWQLSAA